MAQGEDGGIEIDGQTTLLGVDKRLTRGKAQLGKEFCCTELSGGHRSKVSCNKAIALEHRRHGMTPVGPQTAVGALRQGDII